MVKRKTHKHVEEALETGDIPSLRLALTHRQQLFAEEYIVDFNGTAAAIRAGYASKWAAKQANQLLDHPGVRAYLEHLTKSVAAKTMSVNPDYVINKTTSIVSKDGVRDADALRGLELLAKILGMLKDRTEISGVDGEAIKIMQQVEEDSEAITNLLTELSKKTIVLTDN